MQTKLRPLFLSFALSLVAMPSLKASVVINEIFYHAPEDYSDLEWIELHNLGEHPVNLSNWSLRIGVDFTFPKTAKIAAGGYLILCKDKSLFHEFYEAEVTGEFKGGLSNSGETLELVNDKGIAVDRLEYLDTAPWPIAADGYSASLERIVSSSSGNDPHNWAPSVLDLEAPIPSGTPGAVNSSASNEALPKVSIESSQAVEGHKTKITAQIKHAHGVKSASLGYQIVSPGSVSEETFLPMTRNGTQFTQEIPTQAASSLIRYRLSIISSSGVQSFFPNPNAIRPRLSQFVLPRSKGENLAQTFIINTDPKDLPKHERQLKTTQNSDANRQDIFAKLNSLRLVETSLDFSSGWFGLSIKQSITTESAAKTLKALALAEEAKNGLFYAIENGQAVSPQDTDLVRKQLRSSLESVLSPKQLETLLSNSTSNQNGRNPRSMITNSLPVEKDWYEIAVHFQPVGVEFQKLKSAFHDAYKQREALPADRNSFRTSIPKLVPIKQTLNRDIGARKSRYLQKLQRSKGSPIRPSFSGVEQEPPRGKSAFVVVNPEKTSAQVFDYVSTSPRSAGFKVRFQKDRPYNGMSTINIIFEYNDRFTLAETLAFDLYRRAGNASCLTEFVRLNINGQAAGYHLLFEHINGSFLKRNGFDGNGDLYKILWYGRSVEGQHQRKRDWNGGYEHLTTLLGKLATTSGEEQWNLIQANFDVKQVAVYFAINTALSHWDGFFNNYFTYRDSKSGKWNLFPWDQDKTWGFYDSLKDGADFFDMPLTFGMNGDRPPEDASGFGRHWWRPGGHFSGPLLANPQFRKHFLQELKHLLENQYSEEQFFPVIDELAEKLRSEIPVRAAIVGESEEAAMARFNRNIQSLKRHLKKRRGFLLMQDELQDIESTTEPR